MSALLRASRRAPARSCVRSARAASRRPLSGGAAGASFDPADLVEQRAAAVDAFHSQAETLERLLPNEYKQTQETIRASEALVQRAEKAAASRDAKAFGEVQAEVTRLVDESFGALQRQVEQAAVAPRGNYREFEWADKALKEGRTAEAYGLHPDAGALGSAGVLEKYGAGTMLGFLSVIAVAKAVYIPNEETLVVGCFAGFIAAGYIALREQVSADLEEQSSDILKEHQSAVDKYIGAIKTARAFYEDSKGVSAQLAEVAKYYRELEAKFMESRPRYFKSLAVKEIEARLARIESAENAALSAFPVHVADSVHAIVASRLQGASDAARSADVDAAIAKVAGKGAAKGGKDAVRAEYERALAHVLAGWAAARDKEMTVPEGVRAAWQSRIDASLAEFDKTVDPSTLPLDGLVVDEAVVARAKQDFKKSATENAAPSKVRFTF